MKQNYKIYAKNLDDSVKKQFFDALELDCNVYGALMSDAHKGYVIPIGSVIKSQEMIFPAYVGYDIGCGMCALKLDITKEQLSKNFLLYLKEKITQQIPIGFLMQKKAQEYEIPPSTQIAKKIYQKIGKFSLATLGGGNHFIEIGYGKDGYIWIIIHSGSRKFGYEIAKHYMQLAAKEVNEIEGHFGFELSSSLAQEYILDMNCALEFALENRKRMIQKIQSMFGNPKTLQFINKNHNHAEIIQENFVIHRKGATQAQKGVFGVIPANMKDGSFIVKGLGCKESLFSSSHGAGRKLSRKEAKEKLSIKEFHKDMKDIITNHTDATIDESPKAYKDIFEVMQQQKDLVEVVDHIKPLINIKG